MPSCDFTSEDFFSSLTMSMQSSTHSSQMNTVGPAMSLPTSCWLLLQNVQWSVVLVSPPLTLLISEPRLDARRQSLPCRPNHGHIPTAKLFGIEEVPTTRTSHLSEADTSGI